MQLDLELPSTDIDLPIEDYTPVTSCATCGRIIEQSKAKRDATEDFCSDGCMVVADRF